MSKISSFEVGEVVYAKPSEIKKELPGVIIYIHPKLFFATVEFELFKESFVLSKLKKACMPEVPSEPTI